MKLITALLAGFAVFFWHRPAIRSPAGGGPMSGSGSASGEQPADERNSRHHWWPAPLGGLAIGVVVGGWAGAVLAPAAALVIAFGVGRLESKASRKRRARLIADLPLSVELLSACLRAGHSVESSLRAISEALRSPLGEEVAHVAAALRLGAEPREAWARFLAEPALAAVGRAMVRSSESGAPLAELLERLAADVRRARRSEAERRARAVGVKAAAPLGLCFLPAFILIGIVPIVAGAVSDLLR